ncbi:MAG: PAS domain-containing protein [Alphaproteobacteria bacterium]|nr:PAS domain-containing protein [Alphaproteobacteria bacterium]
MAPNAIAPTGRARTFGESEIIVSKTDLRGRIRYANDVFLRLSDYAEAEVLGRPHSIIRHPDMPRAVFKLLWERLKAGSEIFAYVKNMARNGDHYWVLAHVTPTRGPTGEIVGYHSNRRAPRADALAQIEPLYARLRARETGARNAKDGLAASDRLLREVVAETGLTYERFIFTV